jgi:hypothetical protein
MLLCLHVLKYNVTTVLQIFICDKTFLMAHKIHPYFCVFHIFQVYLLIMHIVLLIVVILCTNEMFFIFYELLYVWNIFLNFDAWNSLRIKNASQRLKIKAPYHFTKLNITWLLDYVDTVFFSAKCHHCTVMVV